MRKQLVRLIRLMDILAVQKNMQLKQLNVVLALSVNNT
jgi:hypothetical protein